MQSLKHAARAARPPFCNREPALFLGQPLVLDGHDHRVGAISATIRDRSVSNQSGCRLA